MLAVVTSCGVCPGAFSQNVIVARQDQAAKENLDTEGKRIKRSERENVGRRHSSDRESLGRVPVFTGIHVPMQNLIDYRTPGEMIDAFLDDFPVVTREQVIKFLELS